MPTTIKSRLLKRRGTMCEICSVNFHPDFLTVDHIIQKSKGGSKFDKRNLQLLCQRCHDIKDENKRVSNQHLWHLYPKEIKIRKERLETYRISLIKRG